MKSILAFVGLFAIAAFTPHSPATGGSGGGPVGTGDTWALYNANTPMTITGPTYSPVFPHNGTASFNVTVSDEDTYIGYPSNNTQLFGHCLPSLSITFPGGQPNGLTFQGTEIVSQSAGSVTFKLNWQTNGNVASGVYSMNVKAVDGSPEPGVDSDATVSVSCYVL